MTPDIKELVKRLRAVETRERILGFGGDETLLLFSKEAADALEAMAGEVERLNKLNDELDTAASERLLRAFAAESERDRLKAVGQKLLAKFDHPTASVTQWDVDELRKALGGGE